MSVSSIAVMTTNAATGTAASRRPVARHTALVAASVANQTGTNGMPCQFGSFQVQVTYSTYPNSARGTSHAGSAAIARPNGTRVSAASRRVRQDAFGRREIEAIAPE